MEKSAVLFRQQQQQVKQDEEEPSAKAQAAKTDAATPKPVQGAVAGPCSSNTTLATPNTENSETRPATAGKANTVASTATATTADETTTIHASPPAAKRSDSGPAGGLASPRRSPRRRSGGGGDAPVLFQALGDKGSTRAVEAVGVRVRGKEDPSRGNIVARKSEAGAAAAANGGVVVGLAAAAVRPFGHEEAARAVAAGDVERAGREMFGKAYLSGGALAGVLGAAWVLAEKVISKKK